MVRLQLTSLQNTTNKKRRMSSKAHNDNEKKSNTNTYCQQSLKLPSTKTKQISNKTQGG